jgi:hypothetical protein
MKSWKTYAAIAAASLPLLGLVGCEKTDPTAPDSSTIDLSASPGSLTLGGSDSGTSNLTAIVLDGNGRPVQGISVHFSSTSGTLRSGGAGVKSNSDGISKDVLTLVAGDDDATVKAQAAGATAGTASVAVNAPGENAAPTAAITTTPTPLTVGFGVTFTVSGATSHDTDGSITRYDWNFGNGAAGIITNTTTPTQTYSYPTTGTYQITLTAYDNGDHVGCDTGTHLCTGTKSSIATVNATITNTAPTASITNGSFSIPVNTNVTLDASASRDTEGTIVRYDWTFGDGTAGVTGLVVPTVDHIFTHAGTFTVVSTAWDDGDTTACNPTTHLCHDSKSGTSTVTVTVTP